MKVFLRVQKALKWLKRTFGKSLKIKLSKKKKKKLFSNLKALFFKYNLKHTLTVK